MRRASPILHFRSLILSRQSVRAAAHGFLLTPVSTLTLLPSTLTSHFVSHPRAKLFRMRTYITEGGGGVGDPGGIRGRRLRSWRRGGVCLTNSQSVQSPTLRLSTLRLKNFPTTKNKKRRRSKKMKSPSLCDSDPVGALSRGAHRQTIAAPWVNEWSSTVTPDCAGYILVGQARADKSVGATGNRATAYFAGLPFSVTAPSRRTKTCFSFAALARSAAVLKGP